MSNWEPPPDPDWPDPERRRYEPPDDSPYRETPRDQPPAYQGQQNQPGYDPLGGYEAPPAYEPGPAYDQGPAYGGQTAGTPAYDPLTDYPPPDPGYSAVPEYQNQPYDNRGYDAGYPQPDAYGQGGQELYPPPQQFPEQFPAQYPEQFTGDQTQYMQAVPGEFDPQGEQARFEPGDGLGVAPDDDGLRQPPIGPDDDAPEPPQPRKPGRAGRDLRAAIGVGVGLAALIVLSLYLYPVLFVGLAVVAIVLAVWELSGALASRDIRPPVVPLVVGSVAMLVGAYAGGAEALAVATALTVLGIMMWRLSDGPDGYLRDMSAGVFAALYVPFLAGFAVLMLLPEDGHRRVTVFILVTVFSDIGGYAAGALLGRHPMAPAISPKKTWEGFAGSMLACVVVGAIALPTLLDGALWQGVVVGLAAVATATLGDLAESVIKRDLGIKDMGSLLPGHGGIMDRLDSLLPTAPIAWLLLSVFIPS